VPRKYGWSQTPSNSHLFYTNRLALSGHTQSMLDVRLNDEEVHKNRSVLKILQNCKCCWICLVEKVKGSKA